MSQTQIYRRFTFEFRYTEINLYYKKKVQLGGTVERGGDGGAGWGGCGSYLPFS